MSDVRSQELSRRDLLLTTAAAAVCLSANAEKIAAASLGNVRGRSAQELARDEDFWIPIARAYNLDGQYTILNGGGNNPIPASVVDAMHRFDELTASQPRPHNYVLLNRIDQHRERLARLFNCDADELAITRNTTEGLNTVCAGLDLREGDEVVLSNFDQRYVQPIVDQLVARHGVVSRTVELPMSPTASDVVARYQESFTSKTRLVVASHIVDGFGFVLPVQDLTALAHGHGAQMLVDGALAFGQIPVDVRQIGCDYYATSLHKWLNAPLGTGALFVKRERLTSLWPLYGNFRASDDIRKFEQIGTRCGPTIAAIGQAISFYEQIGPERKAERVKYLSSLVRDALQGVAGVTVLTEVDESRRSGLARIVVAGLSGRELTTILREEHRIYTYGNFPGPYDGVYISPNVFNSGEDMGHLVDSIKQIAARMA
ncbi:MAG: aminotransferase class V-fold PLP-dependent enzyme [Pseudomonadota bacterium]